jgi:hypothetical protein
MGDQRSRLVYSRARHLFRTEMPGVGWSSPDVQPDQGMQRLCKQYLNRAEIELVAEGLISR